MILPSPQLKPYDLEVSLPPPALSHPHSLADTIQSVIEELGLGREMYARQTDGITYLRDRRAPRAHPIRIQASDNWRGLIGNIARRNWLNKEIAAQGGADRAVAWLQKDSPIHLTCVVDFFDAEIIRSGDRQEMRSLFEEQRAIQTFTVKADASALLTVRACQKLIQNHMMSLYEPLNRQAALSGLYTTCDEWGRPKIKKIQPNLF